MSIEYLEYEYAQLKWKNRIEKGHKKNKVKNVQLALWWLSDAVERL